jgi:hypothetical protein
MRTLEELIVRKSIDRFNLEVEASEQPDLMYEIGIYLSRAKDATMVAKAHMEGIEAELAQNIKLEPKAFGYGNEKVTDVIAKSLAKQQQEWKDAFNAYRLVNRYELRVDALYKSIASRQSMLRMLNDLWQSNYFSDSVGRVPTPRVGRQLLKVRLNPEEKVEGEF